MRTVTASGGDGILRNDTSYACKLFGNWVKLTLCGNYFGGQNMVHKVFTEDTTLMSHVVYAS